MFIRTKTEAKGVEGRKFYGGRNGGKHEMTNEMKRNDGKREGMEGE